MRGFVDLHCHWIAGIDDGATSPAMSLEMLRSLSGLGFSRVVATPHMRPGMFDNTRTDILAAFERMTTELTQPDLPETAISSEHYFDDVVLARVLEGDAVLYPGGHAVLFEFYELDFPSNLARLLAEVKRRNITPVIAHPERYQPLWKKPEILESFLDMGAVALLDASAVIGKYGKKAMHCALDLLEREYYYAACTDAHRPADVVSAGTAMRRIAELYGEDEVDALFRLGPNEILNGQVKQ
jgi:protein-tyrosine phosphatase